VGGVRGETLQAKENLFRGGKIHGETTGGKKGGNRKAKEENRRDSEKFC